MPQFNNYNREAHNGPRRNITNNQRFPRCPQDRHVRQEETEGTEGMTLPPDMDKECIELCRAINRLPHLITVDSCCGHVQHGFWIFFQAHRLQALVPLCYWVDVCHCGQKGWRVVATTDCGMSPVSFLLEGPSGEEGYKGAEVIADCITEWIEEGKK